MSPAVELESDQDQYREIHLPAFLGLAFGCIAWLALLGPLLWLVPLAGILASGFALRAIGRSDRALVGRMVALAGLMLSLMFGTAALANAWSYAWMLRREAQPVGQLWFDLVRRGDLPQAHQWTLPTDSRQPAVTDLWAYYRNSPSAERDLRAFAREPLIHLLAAIGDRAEVRYWGSEQHPFYTGHQQIELYTVTLNDGSHKTSFYVRLGLRRLPQADPQGNRWQVNKYEGGIHPGEAKR